MSALNRHRGTAALGIITVLVVGCQAATVSPSPGVTVTPTPSPATPTQQAPTAPTLPSSSPTAAPPSLAPSAAPVPAATSAVVSPAPAGAWVTAGTIASDWFAGAVVPLGDGGALAIGGDGTTAERWDPKTARWGPAATLNATRWNFAAVPLRDGRVLVTGGVNDDRQAYSSTYVYDPATAKGTWTKVGLMGTARSAPGAAVLRDGRVLVVGGVYLDRPALRDDRAPGVVLAAYRPDAPESGAPLPPDDVSPSYMVPALATAEIYDPSTGTWSTTGSMRYARAGASAVTLADGRVLVVSPGGELWVGGDTGATTDRRASTTTEVYEPATGRFALVGSLPDIDREAIAASGVELPTSDPWMTSVGSLIALPDGGAMLVGHADSWKHQADVVRSFRFDARTGRWTQVGPAFAGAGDPAANEWRYTPGIDLAGAFAAATPDGRVLVAGGATGDEAAGWQATRTARTYDPVTSTWAPLPPMPEARNSGETAVLSDGSVLLVGGSDSSSGAVTAVRFDPSP